MKLLTPNELVGALTEIVARNCRCTSAWIQHPGPVTPGERENIRAEVECLFDDMTGRSLQEINDTREAAAALADACAEARRAAQAKTETR